jgi:putative transposase
MSTRKLSHVVWDCKYHVVIVPKYRYKVFEKEIRESVRDEIKTLCVWMRVEILEGHVCKDHVHLCLAIPPKMAISEIIGRLKGTVAIRMFNRYPELRSKYWGSHFWSRGYYVNTVGRNEEQICQYIRGQDKLDRKENQGKLFL